jgi:RNA polymerase sigma-70 factor, ECF subfamily
LPINLNIPFDPFLFTLYFSVSVSTPAELQMFPESLNKTTGMGIYMWVRTHSRIDQPMDRTADSTAGLPFATATGAASSPKPSENERVVMDLFEQFRNPLLRYALSFGIPVHDAEEIIQEVFLALFRHLQARGSQKNLRGWIFRVTHNLALKQRSANQRSADRQLRTAVGETAAEQQPDPSPNPEEHLSTVQRRRLLLAVVNALPTADQSCLRLRAEGLRYREIASVLGMSSGAVSISLTRSRGRLIRADRRE